MASIKIHQDIYNFERTRKGFTDRQLASAGLALAVLIATVALFGYAIGVPYPVAVVLGTALAAPAVVAGFVPLYGIKAEEFAQRVIDLSARGNTIYWSGEHVEPMGHPLTKEYLSRMKRKGAECARTPDAEETRKGIFSRKKAKADDAGIPEV